MKENKDLSNLRDCVRLAFEKGSKRGHEFEKMRHGIIVELKRLGYTASEINAMLLEWNNRCEKPLSYVEQKRQLFDYVEWVDKMVLKVRKPLKIGCRALEDYCVGEEKCFFKKKELYLGRKATEVLPFDFAEVKNFLETRYRGPESYVMYLILKNLRRYQMEKGVGEIIFIGHKGIAELLYKNNGHRIEVMTINRRIKDLVNEGLIEIVIKGKKGTFSVQANGYRLLPWSAPLTYSN